MVRRYTRVYTVYTDIERVFKVLSDPARFLKILDFFDGVSRVGEEEAEAVIEINMAFGIKRTLRARFRRAVEPPVKIVLIGEGGFAMTIAAELTPLTTNETRLELSIQLSASFLAESALAYRIATRLETLKARIQEGITGIPIAVPVEEKSREQAVPEKVEEKAEIDLDKHSERLEDPLVLSELLLNSKYIASFRITPQSFDELAGKIVEQESKSGYYYLVVTVLGEKRRTYRLLLKNRKLYAISAENGERASGSKALDEFSEAFGERMEVKVFEPSSTAIEKIIS